MSFRSVCKGMLTFAAATMFWGCTSTQVADLADCGRASIGMGLGLDVTAKAGSLAHLGLGVVGSKTARIGHENRHWTGTWAEDQFVWPYEWARRADVFQEDEYLRGLSVISAYTRDYYTQCVDDKGSIEVTYMFPIFEPPPQRKSAFSYGELTDLEVGFTFFVVSARIGINPLEIADAIAGIWDVDFAGDDKEIKEAMAMEEAEGMPDEAEMEEEAAEEGAEEMEDMPAE